MENELPLVSVGIPTYNSKNSLKEAITSVLRQGYPRLEVIVSDDCSTDGTHEACLALAEEYPFIRYIRQPKNVGLTQNFEYVLRNANGEFFMWVAHDDLLEPGIINKYVDFMIKHEDYSLVSGQIRYFSGNRGIFFERDFNLIHKKPGMRVVRFYFKVVHGAIYYGMMRREFAETLSLRNRIGDDWHFVASLSYLGKIKNLDCVGYHKRLGGTSKTFEQFASTIGASRFAARFPHVAIALDAFSEIFFHSPVYNNMPRMSKFMLATFSTISILTSYYFKVFPFIVGGKIKRLFIKINKQWSPITVQS